MTVVYTIAVLENVNPSVFITYKSMTGFFKGDVVRMCEFLIRAHPNTAFPATTPATNAAAANSATNAAMRAPVM